jgi:hypothetical protein
MGKGIIEEIVGKTIGETVFNMMVVMKRIGMEEKSYKGIFMELMTNYNLYGEENENRMENIKEMLIKKLPIDDYISLTQYKKI